MTELTRLDEIDEGWLLSFECGDLPSDAAVRGCGHEPTGYFWDGVATYLVARDQPDLVDTFDFDSEAGTFAAQAEQEAPLVTLRALLQPYVDGTDEINELVEEAESEGFAFED